VATERALKALYRSAFIAGAALGGGPPAAAAATAFLETDLGKAGIDNVTTWTTSERKSSSSNNKGRIQEGSEGSTCESGEDEMNGLILKVLEKILAELKKQNKGGKK